MELQVTKLGQGSVTPLSVDSKLFDCEFNEGLVHQIVTAYQAGGRLGTKAQKTRSDVSGGGKKPWRQKGTGRARAGTTRGPLWRGGGVTFAARPRCHAQKVNRKMYRKAMAVILSELQRQNRLQVVDELVVNAAKTRELLSLLKPLAMTKGLIVTATVDNNLRLAARNIPALDVISAPQVDPVSLVAAPKVIITVAALESLMETLK